MMHQKQKTVFRGRASRHLSFESLQPADVLLLRGLGDLSDSIAALDGSEYSHAALCVDAGLALEAKVPSVKTKPLAEVLEARVCAHVFRHRQLDGAARARVVSTGQRLESTEYSGSTLLLNLVLVTLLSQGNAATQDAISALVGELIHSRELRQPIATRGVTCSELVARAFAEAGQPLAVVQPDDRRANMRAFVQALRAVLTNPQYGWFRDMHPSRLANALKSRQSVVPEALKTSTPEQRIVDALLMPAGDERIQALVFLFASLKDESHVTELLLSNEPPRPHDDWRGQKPRLTWDPVPFSAEHPIRPEALEVTAGLDWPLALVTPRMLAESPDLSYVGSLNLKQL